MTDIERLKELAGLNELQTDSPFVDLDQAVNAALSYYNSGQSDGSVEEAVKYAAQEYQADYEALLAQTKFFLKHPEELKSEGVDEDDNNTNTYFVWGFPNKKGRYKITGITKDERGVYDIQMGKNGVWYDPNNNSGTLKFSSRSGQPLSAGMIYNAMNRKKENVGEDFDELPPPIPGLEGPWKMKNGRVVYYDPKEGEYYDRGKDMYLSQDEANDLHYGNMREEYDAFKEEFKSDWNSSEMAEADPYGGGMNAPPEGGVSDSSLSNAIEDAIEDAKRYDVSEFSTDPDDYEGQLEYIVDEIIGEHSGSEEIQVVDDWYQTMTQHLEPIIGPMLQAHMGMAEGDSPHPKGSKKYKDHMAAMHAGMGESNLNELEKAPKFAWFEPSKGPNNYPGVELRYLEINPKYDPTSTPSMMKDGPFYTPSFGWWKSIEDYHAGGESFSDKTKEEVESEHNLQWLDGRPSREEGMELLKVTNEGLGEDWRDKVTGAMQKDTDKLHDQAAEASARGDHELSNKLMRQRDKMLKKEREQGKYSLGNNPRFHPTTEDKELSRLQHLAGIEEGGGVGVLTAQNTTADVKKGTLKKQGAKFGFDITDMGIPPRISKDSGNK